MNLYALAMFKKYRLNYNWKTIYVGRQLGLISAAQVQQYAFEYLEQHSNSVNPFVAEIAYGVPEKELDNVLKNVIKTLYGVFLEKDGLSWNLEKRKWRYCILAMLVDSVHEENVLIENVDSLYEIFDYPDDMVNFVSYRPESKIRKFVAPNTMVIEVDFPEYLKNLRLFLENEWNMLKSND